MCHKRAIAAWAATIAAALLGFAAAATTAAGGEAGSRWASADDRAGTLAVRGRY